MGGLPTAGYAGSLERDMFEATILVPTHNNDKTPKAFPQALYDALHEEIRKRFGGFTLIAKTFGQWDDEHHALGSMPGVHHRPSLHPAGW